MHPTKISIFCPVRVFLALAAVAAFASCASNDELQERMDRRNDNSSSLQDRRAIRQEAREQRSDDWYERVMR